MGSKSRSFLFDLSRFSLGDGHWPACDVITKVITRDAVDFVGSGDWSATQWKFYSR